jgi:cyclase
MAGPDGGDDTARHLHVRQLSETLFGYYDGRRLAEPDSAPMSWVDDGALSLGICSYAFLDGREAVVYDTHVSTAHARRIRTHLHELGAREIRVVLSHWHLDHVAGNEVFADCEIIANDRTDALLREHRAAIEAGTFEGPPAISPLVLPTTTFDDRMDIETRNLHLELASFEIHSSDATVLHVPATGVLLAGDTVEDTVTYVGEPERLEVHVAELERMRRIGARAIYPNHGSLGTLEGGGYAESLIDATQSYVRDLRATAGEPLERHVDLATFVSHQLSERSITWFAPYQRVHEANLLAVRAQAV